METWLSELGLHFKDIDEDFSNGYILGSILYRYNLQEDFGSFSSKPSYVDSNLTKVQATLERLNIKFAPARAKASEPGYMLKVLGQIYKALHNVSFTNLRPVRGKSAVPIARAKKNEMIENALKRFDEVRVRQSEKALKDEKKQLEQIRNGYMDERNRQIEKLQSNKLFMKKWETEGKGNWKSNQMRKTARIRHEENVMAKLAADIVQKKVENNLDHCTQVADGIKEFERNMIRLGIDHPPEQKDLKKKKIDIKTEALVTMAKIIERKTINQQATKEREVRQRNLIVEQRKNEKFDKYKKASARMWVSLRLVFSKQYTFGFVGIKKHAHKMRSFNDSLKNTEELLRKTQMTWGKIEEDRRKQIDEEEKAKKKVLAKEKHEIQSRIIQQKRTKMTAHIETCLPILDLVLEITEEASNYLKTHDKIPEKLWDNWLGLFKNNLPPTYKDPTLLKSYSLSNKDSLTGRNDKMQDLMDLTFAGIPEISPEAVNEYLECEGIWSYSKCVNNFLLGDILETIITIAYPKDPDPPLPEGPNYLPLKVILIGPGFSGKKTQTKKLQDNYGLKVVEMGKILEDAKKVAQRKAEMEDPKTKKKIVEEEPEIFVQACSETMGEDVAGRNKLFRARLRGMFGDVPKIEEEAKKILKKDEVKCQGFLVINYPTTIEEAIDLERQMSCFIHPSELPEPLSSIKAKEAMIIAKPSVKPLAAQRMFRSAWDLVIILDVDQSICVTRAVDRRIDPAGNIYNMTYNPPPDNILHKCKVVDKPTAAEVQEMYAEFSPHRETLLNWFSQFGNEFTTNLIHIRGTQNADAVFEIIKQKISGVLRDKSLNVTPNASNRDITVIKFEQAEELCRIWENIKSSYLDDAGKYIAFAEMHWNMFNGYLDQRKSEFLSFLQMPDEKASLFSEFKDYVHEVINSKSIFTSTEIATFNLQAEDLMDSIWDVIAHRKDQAIKKRQKIIDSSILPQQIAGICHIAMCLLQTELNKYYSIMNFVEKYYYYLDCRQLVQHPTPQLKINWEDWPDKSIGESLLKHLIISAKGFTLNLTEHAPETYIYLSRIENINKFALEAMKKYRKRSEELFIVLDEWICKAVELENKAMVSKVNDLKKVLSTRVTNETMEFPSNIDILLDLVNP